MKTQLRVEDQSGGATYEVRLDTSQRAVQISFYRARHADGMFVNEMILSLNKADLTNLVIALHGHVGLID